MTSVLSSYKQKDRGSGYFVQIINTTASADGLKHETVDVPPPTVYIKTDASEILKNFATPSAPGDPGYVGYAAGALFKDIGREVYVYGPDTDPFITSPIRLQAIWREVYPVNQGEIPAVSTIWIKVFSAANPASISVVRAG